MTPQQRATLIGTLLMMDYMFFERDIDMCGVEREPGGGNKVYINFCNCYCFGQVCPCQLKGGGGSS
jgi:hypothetical protein